jgi:sensor histidine kinase YesM
MKKVIKKINNKPLKTKIMLGMFIPVFVVVFFYVMMSNSSQRIIDRFEEAMDEQVRFFELMESINENIGYLDDYMSDLDEEALESYYFTKTELEDEIESLYHKNYSKEIMFNIRAIDYSFRAYTEDFESAISQRRTSDEDFVYAYYNALHIKDYTELYFENIMNIFLEESRELSIVIQSDVDNLRFMYFVSIILLIVLMYFVAHALSSYLVGPIIKLRDSAKKISDGNFNIEIKSIETEDEIGDLSHAFNIMVKNIKENVDNLEQMAEYEKELRIKDTEYWKMQENLQKAKFSALQSQIEPHFLFNTLNTISRMSMFEEAEKTGELIQSLATLFRHRLRHDDLVSLDEELLIIKEYLSLQKVRFDDRLKVHVDLLDQSDIMIPIFTIQPLVENAIIHGIEPKIDGGEINVLVNETETEIEISVQDTGMGISNDKLEKLFDGHDPNHIGLSNVRERFLKAFNNNASFKIESELKVGTKITLTIFKEKN